MRRSRRSQIVEPHPLEPVVVKIFRARPHQDRITLADGLKSDPFKSTHIKPNPKGPRLGMSGDRAYLVVAEDVLGYMESQGKLVRDSDGWYLLAPHIREAS